MVFLFLEYDFKVMYKPRKKHVVVDVLIFKKKLFHQPKNFLKSNLKNGCQMGKCHAHMHGLIHDCRLPLVEKPHFATCFRRLKVSFATIFYHF
jgi:hypothetical protein